MELVEVMKSNAAPHWRRLAHSSLMLWLLRIHYSRLLEHRKAFHSQRGCSSQLFEGVLLFLMCLCGNVRIFTIFKV